MDATRAPVIDHGIDPDVYRRRWWTLAVLCLSLLIIMVGNTSLNVALPVLSEKLGASNSQLQWIVDGYSLVFAGLLFTAGNIGDRYGRKGILQAGLVLFALATGYAAFVATSAEQLIGARVVMGAAAAMVMPATLSIITNVFPTEERARAVALWAGISGAGMALGPLMSGFLLEHWGWNLVFATNLPLILAAVVSGALLVPRLRSDHHSPLDLPGAVLSAGGMGLLIYTLIEAPANGWLSPHTLLFAAVSLIVIAAFILWELRAESPMLDVRLFRIGAFGVSSLVLTLVFFALMGTFFSMTQLLQLVYGYSPLGAAVRLIPISIAMVIAAPRSAKLAARFGKRKVVAGGMWCIGIGIGSTALIGIDANYLLLVSGLFVMAIGMGLAMSPTTDLLMSSVPREKAGMGSAMNDTTRELGGSLGVAVFGSLLASRYSDQLAPHVAILPPAAQEAASGSLAGALGVAQGLGDGSNAMAVAAREAWVSGFRLSVLAAAVVVMLAGVLAYRFLPDQAADVASPIDDEALLVFESEALAAERQRTTGFGSGRDDLGPTAALDGAGT
jgi:EmrB/QacA subfamily drug resistance transporter